MHTSGGKELRGESVGSSALPLSKPCSLKNQSGLSLEGPLAVLSNLCRREWGWVVRGRAIWDHPTVQWPGGSVKKPSKLENIITT